MNNSYLTANDHERYLDTLAWSKAMCADNIRHGVCSTERCSFCEKKALLDSCEAELAPYSRLLLNDKTEAAIHNIIVANPTPKEARERVERERQTYKKAFVQAQKDMSWEFMHSGGWVAIVTVILVPIIVPIIGCMEWFL